MIWSRCRGWLFFSFWLVGMGAALAQTQAHSKMPPAYRVETIMMPPGLVSETGALAFLPNGELAAGFSRGEIMIYNTQTQQWRLFAQGLHDPLGLLALTDTELLIMQRPELTRVKDTDGDGAADWYETLTDDFGLTGNYHEFNYGPVKDLQGNLYIALNTASPNGGVRSEVRGKLDTTTLGKYGRQMFSVVPYRGWVMQLTPQGKLLPFASGFRSPNGLVIDAAGNLLVTDNQGDWVGTSPLYEVQAGNFYGHPASLGWAPSHRGQNPFIVPVPALEQLRTRAAVLFPHGIMANSVTQPVFDNTNGKFGPFGGQLLVGEMNQERLVRVMLERVNGVLQGACTPFLDGQGLRKGNNRLAFAPDGSLWVGQSDHGWAGDEGIQRIVFTGQAPLDIYTMQLTPAGFNLTFTQPLDSTTAQNPANFQFKHYYYHYHARYGSDQVDAQPVPVTSIHVSADRRQVAVSLAALKPGYVYEMQLRNLKSAGGAWLPNKIVCYTLNQLKN